MSSLKEAKDLQGQRGCIPYVHTHVHTPWLTSHTCTHVCAHTHCWLVAELKLTLHHPPLSHNRLQPPMIFRMKISRITTK